MIDFVDSKGTSPRRLTVRKSIQARSENDVLAHATNERFRQRVFDVSAHMLKIALNGDFTARVADSTKAIIALLISLAGSVNRGAIGSSRTCGAASSI